MEAETEWRRRWKPCLTACPWQNVDGENLLIKLKFSENTYEVLITDLTSFWHESLEEKDLKKRIEKLNPSIEAPVTKILDQIKLNLDKKAKDSKISVSFEKSQMSAEQKMLLKIGFTLAGMPFVWEFHAEPADSSMARDHLTVPLLTMVAELFRRQQELVTIIAAKDKEIDDYKSQGVRTSRKHIETAKFDSIAFKNSMLTSKGFEAEVQTMERVTFNTDSQELYRHIVTKLAWLRHKANQDGDQEVTSDGESIPMSGQETTSTKQSWINRLPPSLMPSKDISPVKTPAGSPVKSAGDGPSRSPVSNSSSSDSTPVKDSEKLRREALERKLAREELKMQDKKKKKKIAF